MAVTSVMNHHDASWRLYLDRERRKTVFVRIAAVIFSNRRRSIAQHFYLRWSQARILSPAGGRRGKTNNSFLSAENFPRLKTKCQMTKCALEKDSMDRWWSHLCFVFGKEIRYKGRLEPDTCDFKPSRSETEMVNGKTERVLCLAHSLFPSPSYYFSPAPSSIAFILQSLSTSYRSPCHTCCVYVTTITV